MPPSTYTRNLFRTAALFNFGAAALFLPITGIAPALGLQPLAGNDLFAQIALLAIFTFGLGYWMVSNDPQAHRGIVRLGTLAKLGVVALAWAHVLFIGDANVRMGLLVSGDLLYALLFLQHLRNTD